MGLPVLTDYHEGEIVDSMGPGSFSFWQCLRYKCDESILNYTKYFMQLTEGTRFIESLHHELLSDTLERVINGEIKCLIINIPPGTTKTEFAVKGLIGRALGINPRCRFLHLSANSDLALRNSSEIKDVLQTEDYQAIYPETRLKPGMDSKAHWKTTAGGGVYAVATGGAVIGFRAGRMEIDFSGCIIIDDPHKPEDIYSELKRTRQNERFNHTVKTRKATPYTPVIIIMQRLHDDDLTGFLLKGGSGDRWHHLSLPVEIPAEREPYPAEYTHGIEIPYDLPAGPLWLFKYGPDEIQILKADDFTFSAQFMQKPSAYGGGVFNTSHFKYYADYDPKAATVTKHDGTVVKLEYKNVYCDTAMKTGERNDYSVFQLWGKGNDGNIYLLDQVRGKWEAPVLKNKFLKFCKKHDYGENNGIGIRARKIEDKSSGTGLIQEIQRLKGRNYVIGIPRDKDKVSRARSGTIPMAEGKVFIPSEAYWIDDYKYEFQQFSPLDTHKHDDQIDPTLDAISDMITASTTAERYLQLIGGGSDK